MTKKYTKLIAAVLLMLVAFLTVIASTYAWLTISNSPIAEGIQIAIGGSGTILIAPDMTEQVEGITYHYPGLFEEQINFSQWKSYDYLQNLAGLSPVSTADGKHWFIPTYYSSTDEEVVSGNAIMGQLKPPAQHIDDQTLAYANLPLEQLEQAREGSYIYLDFWVVSPGGDYQLRISGQGNTGSFLLGLPNVEAQNDSFHLVDNSAQLSASARVGFLTNTNIIRDNTLLYYARSPHYNNTYSKLRGYYEEPGKNYHISIADRFTIYEPNGDLHANTVYNTLGDEIVDGQYAFTKPIGPDGTPVSVQDRLTVQRRNIWHTNEHGLRLEQLFQASIAGKSLDHMTPDEIEEHFYFNYMQQQLSAYLDRGSFLKRTDTLYGLNKSVVTQEELQSFSTAGATDDIVIVELEKNVPQRIRMFIWLEGQDPDCVGFSESVRFCVGLELAGGSQ